MKKWLFASSIVALVVVSFLFLVVLTDKTKGMVVFDAKQMETMKKNAQFAEGTLDFELYFEGEKLPFDQTTNTYYLPLNMETKNWESGSITADHDTRLFFSSDFTKKEKQTLIAENEAVSFYALQGNQYVQANLVFSGMPALTISSTEFLASDGSALYEMRLLESDKKDNWVTSCYTTSSLRGNTSLAYEKLSLRLKLCKQNEDGDFEKKNASLLGLREDDDWILNSLYADSTRIKDKLAIDLWNETGAMNNSYNRSFGCDAEYTELFINDQYQGIYLLISPIDSKQLGMDAVSEQLENEQTVVERIYKKKYSGIWNESDFVGALPDQNMPDYRGGFYLKGDTILGTEEEWEPLRKLAHCIASDDDQFEKDITSIVDKDNALDMWLYIQAIAGFDNYAKNYYYVARNKGNAYYGYFVPWDMNLSFGDVYAENSFYSEKEADVVDDLIAWEPAQRMIDLDVENSSNDIKTKWDQWRMGVFSDAAMLERISELEHAVKDSGALERETTKWPDGNTDGDFSFMKEFALKRLQFVDEYVEQK